MKKEPPRYCSEAKQEAGDAPSNTFIQTALSRRSFIRMTAGALITVNIIPLALTKQIEASEGTWEPEQGNEGWQGEAGIPNYRIDGLAKVTGAKVYARDYHSRDMDGWPAAEQLVMIIRAVNVNQVFSGLDLSLIPAEYHPTNVIYGEAIKDGVMLKNTIMRDQHLDEVEDRIRLGQIKVADGVKLPSDFIWPFMVLRGQGADFYGQPVAFLIFKDRQSYLGAKKAIQFVDGFQQYGAAVPPSSVPPLSPLTNYVRVAGESSTDVFSYAQNHDDQNYTQEADNYRAQIQTEITNKGADGTWKVYSDSFTMQAMDPMFMEPESGIAWYDAVHKTLNLVVGTQSPDGDVNALLGMFEGTDISVSTVNLFSCYPGGGFGGRDSSVFTLNLGIAAVFGGGNPVRLAYDRFEQFQCGLKRHACEATTSIAFTQDGSVQALDASMQFDSGGRRNLSPYVAQLAGVCAGGCYDIPQSAIFSEALYSNNVSGGSQRGFGGAQAYFIIESLCDQAAVDMAISPFDIRRKNALQTGQKTVVGGPISQSLQLDTIIDMAEADPIWRNRAADRQRWEAEGLQYGVGFAMSNQAYGTSGDGVLAAVSIAADGSLQVRTNAIDMGNGSATTLAVVIADALGANASKIEMGNADLWDALQMKTGWSSGSWSDNDWTPKSVGSSSACLTAFHQVHAVMQSAQALFDVGILPAAIALWGGTPAQTEWVDGMLTVPDTSLPALTRQQIATQIMSSGGISSVLGHAYFQETWAEGTFTLNGYAHSWALDSVAFNHGNTDNFTPLYRTSIIPTPKAASGYVRTAFAPCGNLVGVTVNPNTGDVVVCSSASFLNAGRVIVEGLVSGQSQGGIAMAMGWTLFEDMPPGLAGPAAGDWNLNRYFVSRANDVPMDQRLITLTPESGEATGRGIAEAVMCSVAPAISNAIFDAAGIRMRHLPITPKKVWEALND